MSSQEFTGPVGQVAGRDLINVASQRLWDSDTDSVVREAQRCRQKLWQQRRSAFMKLAATWLAFGLLGIAWYWSLMTFVLPGSRSYGGLVLFGAIVLAIALLPKVAWALRRGNLKLIQHYKLRLDIIDTILVDRR